MPILEGRRIVKDFPGKRSRLFERNRTFRALDDVSLFLEEGTTLGIVGESGSGKSTLGEILGDLQRPSSGIVLYEGRDIRSLDRDDWKFFRKNVQFIFQNPKESMNPFFTIRKVLFEPMSVMLGLRDEEEMTERSLHMLERVGLSSEVLSKYPSELSGGQCQRIAIARALLLSPRVVICDEAVASLDVSVEAQILNLLKKIQMEDGTSYIFISHDIGVIRYMSDSVMVLLKGHVVESGPVDKVIFDPREEYTRRLVLGEENN